MSQLSIRLLNLVKRRWCVSMYVAVCCSNCDVVCLVVYVTDTYYTNSLVLYKWLTCASILYSPIIILMLLFLFGFEMGMGSHYGCWMQFTNVFVYYNNWAIRFDQIWKKHGHSENCKTSATIRFIYIYLIRWKQTNDIYWSYIVYLILVTAPTTTQILPTTPTLTTTIIPTTAGDTTLAWTTQPRYGYILLSYLVNNYWDCTKTLFVANA